ncbi:hypothetical protein N7532_007997 [Penicillium argentinense]|uniref:Uncharacterized protein n=1 Tax=Penicillium argentinense TaxID=1131581 RepID=A0A9W9EWH9_9EURO|nr:uncharacterized protein N7532_007997 [Penicillium argentinense]KAJ5089313.1 hypothetical protein N7532_007997 [Penicillium argentinense]
MGQRHNRRRTRPRSRNRNTASQDIPASTVFHTLGSPLLATSSIWPPQSILSELPATSYQPASCISLGSPAPAHLAPTWHYGYTAWQIRENAPRESGGLEAEQCRLFGGEPGDDVGLCYRMLEYFGGLDYIDSTRNSTLGD